MDMLPPIILILSLTFFSYFLFGQILVFGILIHTYLTDQESRKYIKLRYIEALITLGVVTCLIPFVLIEYSLEEIARKILKAIPRFYNSLLLRRAARNMYAFRIKIGLMSIVRFILGADSSNIPPYSE